MRELVSLKKAIMTGKTDSYNSKTSPSSSSIEICCKHHNNCSESKTQKYSFTKTRTKKMSLLGF